MLNELAPYYFAPDEFSQPITLLTDRQHLEVDRRILLSVALDRHDGRNVRMLAILPDGVSGVAGTRRVLDPIKVESAPGPIRRLWVSGVGKIGETNLARLAENRQELLRINLLVVDRDRLDVRINSRKPMMGRLLTGDLGENPIQALEDYLAKTRRTSGAR